MIKHMLFYTPAKLIPALTGLATLVLLTRVLPADQFGLYSLAVTAMMVGQTTLTSWLVSALVRLLPGAATPKERAELLAGLGAWFGVMFLLLSLFLAGVVALFDWHGKEGLNYYTLTLLLTLAFSAQQLVLRVHMADLKSGRFSVLQSLQSLLSLLFMAVAVYFGSKTANAPLFGILIGYIILILADMRALAPFLRWRRANRAVMRTIWNYAGVLILIGVFGYLAMKVDRFILQHYCGEEAVGFYSAGVSLAEQAISAVFMIVAMASHPLAVRAVDSNDEDLKKKQLGMNALWILGLGMPASLGFAAIAPELATLLLGDAFREQAAAIMPIIALAALAANLRGHYVEHYFLLARRNDLLVIALIPSALAALLINLLVIPKYGVMGAAYTALGVQVTALVVAYAIVSRITALYIPWGDMAKICAASIAMVGVTLLIPKIENLTIAIGAKMASGLVFYTAAVLVMNVGGMRQALLKRYRS